MSNLWVEENYNGIDHANTDNERRYSIGESGAYETFTDNLGKLYKSLSKEYGRCVSKMYVDRKDGETIQTGWVFQKRMKYTDARGNDKDKDYYLQETWVSVYKSKPVRTVKVEYEYAF